MGVTSYECRWEMKDRVCINLCDSIVGFVTGVYFTSNKDCTVKVSWFHEGKHNEEWFYDWQLSKGT